MCEAIKCSLLNQRCSQREMTRDMIEVHHGHLKTHQRSKSKYFRNSSKAKAYLGVQLNFNN